jgi:flagellar assembly protein FliH
MQTVAAQETTSTEEQPQPKFMSQKDFKPTPFKKSEWEVVGERFDTESFLPIEVPVLAGQEQKTDPMFEDFGSTVPRDASMLYHGGGQAPERQVVRKGVAQREEEKPAVAQISEEELQAKFEEGRRAGFLEGENAAKELIAQRYDAITQRLDQFSNGIGAEVRAFFAQVEMNSINLALSVAKKLLLTTAEAKPEYIIEVIRKGLQSLGAGKPLKIRVSNDDYEFLKVVGLPAELSTEELGVEYTSDENIKAGCVIETDYGEIDLQIETMWEQVKESLFEACRQ